MSRFSRCTRPILTLFIVPGFTVLAMAFACFSMLAFALSMLASHLRPFTGSLGSRVFVCVLGVAVFVRCLVLSIRTLGASGHHETHCYAGGKPKLRNDVLIHSCHPLLDSISPIAIHTDFSRFPHQMISA